MAVSPQPELVTIDQVKRHLRITSDEEYSDVQDKVDMATAIVLDYLTRREDDDWMDTMEGWTASTVPGPVRAAILRQIAELYRFRGDDLDGDQPKWDGDDLSPGVKMLLKRYRDPVIA